MKEIALLEREAASAAIASGGGTSRAMSRECRGSTRSVGGGESLHRGVGTLHDHSLLRRVSDNPVLEGRPILTVLLADVARRVAALGTGLSDGDVLGRDGSPQ